MAGEKICCFIPEGKKSGEVQILKSIRFAAQPGKLMAIMGPSGSGKTTLVNILAGRTVTKQQGLRKRKPRMVITGCLYLNGNAVSSDEMTLYSRYVMQKDRLFEYLTVAETLTFAAKLKLRGCSRAEIKAHVEHVIDEMGLHSCRDVLIGGQISKGVSGGQKKRVAVAIELLDNPEIIFLDEPTSGLDSSLAFDVVKILKDMTKKGGRTVIATIHQPRSQIFKMFDTLLLLSRGEVVFHGPAFEAGIFATEIGLVVPLNFNIADFLLDVLTVGKAKTELTDELIGHDRRSFTESGRLDLQPEEVLQFTRAFITDEELQKLPDKFSKTSWAENLYSQIDEIIANPRLEPVVTTLSARNHTIHYCKTIITLMHRHFVNKLRDPGSTAVRLGVTAIMALINGLLYFQIEFPTNSFDCRRFYNVLGALAFVCFSLSFGSLDIIIHFPESRPQYNREVASRMYRPSAFYIAQCIGDIPFLAMGAILLTLIVYWMVGYGERVDRIIFFLQTEAEGMSVSLCLPQS